MFEDKIMFYSFVPVTFSVVCQLPNSLTLVQVVIAGDQMKHTVTSLV